VNYVVQNSWKEVGALNRKTKTGGSLLSESAGSAIL
jgi:hypothetical protein